jgi:hypothetical protein
VTRFDFETFPQGVIFAGTVVCDYEHKDAIIDAFNTFSNHRDVKAATWLSIAYGQGRKVLSPLAMYAEPNPNAEVLQPYLSVPSLYSTAKVRSLADMVHEIAVVNVKNHRQNYTTRHGGKR